MDKDILSTRNSKTHASHDEKVALHDRVSARRRSLIKASAAGVPAIMTLRSGAAAAAAAASLHICIEQDAARAAIELGPEDNVLGDEPGETALDQWVRVSGKVGRVVNVASGNSGNSSVYYCIKNTGSTATWDDIAGWDCYDSNYLLVDNNGTLNAIERNWDAVTNFNFYCVNKAGVWECLDENGNPVTPTIQAANIDTGKDVYLLVYVSSFNGEIIGATYYPKIALVQDQQANPITGSCLCSVDPNFQILG